MDIDLRSVAIVILLASLVVLAGCTVMGTGRSTLVLADPPPQPPAYTGNEFSHLIASPARKLVGLGDKPALDFAAWDSFRTAHYGAMPGPAATVGLNVRDQTNTPALDLFNVETTSSADVTKILTDNTLTTEQKDALLTKLRDNYRGMPESYSRLVVHGIDASGGFVYHYFPQVTLDLTGTLNSAEPLDHFDYLAAAIRIPQGSHIRFINFSPKAADLFDFTLGQMKQTASATATASAADKATVSATTADTPKKGPATTSGTGGEANLGGSLSFALSDELTRDLKYSLEARSAGILDEGRLFLIELRSNEQKRIAGTYTFNVMLEVPSEVTRDIEGNRTTWTSDPVEKDLTVEVRVVGIVRHVVKPGRTGTFKRVPEPLNDTTFREVVLRDASMPLWKFSNFPIGQIFNKTNLTVFTNRDDASFTVYDEKTGAMLFHGRGREQRFVVAGPDSVKVVFHPIIVGDDKPVALKAPTVTRVAVGAAMSAIGNYAP